MSCIRGPAAASCQGPKHVVTRGFITLKFTALTPDPGAVVAPGYDVRTPPTAQH